MGISISTLQTGYRYLYLTKFNTNGDTELNEQDNPVFSNVASPEEAERALIGLSLRDQYDLITRTIVNVPAVPQNYVEVTVAEGVDGDTYKATLGSKTFSVRVDEANTTEYGKGGPVESRRERAQTMATDAADRLVELFSETANKVWINANPPKDRYGRSITMTFLQRNGFLQNLSALLILEGQAHTYFVNVDDETRYSSYLFLQEVAKAKGLGLWADPHFKDASEHDGFKDIHITSFHANADGEPDPLDKEYFRLANIASHSINLSNYQVFNKLSGKTVALPDFEVPPGRTVKIATGNIHTQNNPSTELELSLEQKRELWQNNGSCLVFRSADGSRIIDFESTRGQSCPQNLLINC